MMNGERTRLIITPMTNEAQLATTFRTERRQFVKGWTAAADVIMCTTVPATRGLSRRSALGAGKSPRQARSIPKPSRATGARSDDRAQVVSRALPLGQRDPRAPAGHEFDQSPFIANHLARGFRVDAQSEENIRHLDERSCARSSSQNLSTAMS